MKKHGNSIEQMIGGKTPKAAQPADPAGQDPEFTGLVNEIFELMQGGGMPEGFDLEEACRDAEFIELAGEYGAAAAARIWTAERRAAGAESSAMQRVNRQMQTRRGLPRPAGGGGYAAPRADYANMDSATFKKLSQELKRSARNGKRVPL